ncbi:MAG: hypothetical protein R3B13_34915 [Polyangiaceae bacterium]
MRRARGAAILVTLALVSVAWWAPADDAVDPARKKEAAALFRKAEAAFKKHDYGAAAEGFEQANRIAPHPAALFNAARAYERAGALARAANLCAQYLRDAPENDSRRPKAAGLLAELRPKLGRVTVIAVDAEDITLDGEALELDETYVDPGDHQVAGRFGEQRVKRKVNVVAGSLERVTLEPKKAAAALEETPDPKDAPEADGPPSAESKPSSGLEPTWFYVGVGATVVLAGATVWSGLDTNSARDDFDANPTSDALADGESKQRRTNLLLGGTAVAAVATGVLAAFTNFSGKKATPPPEGVALSLAAGPRSVVLSGQF